MRRIVFVLVAGAALAGGMVDLVALGSKAPQELFVQVVSDVTTAILIILATSFGLIFPNMFIQ